MHFDQLLKIIVITSGVPQGSMLDLFLLLILRLSLFVFQLILLKRHELLRYFKLM